MKIERRQKENESKTQRDEMEGPLRSPDDHVESPADSDSEETVRAEMTGTADNHEPTVQKEKPAAFYDQKDVAMMLLADAFARKNQQWNLVCSAGILQLGKTLQDSPMGIGFNENELLMVGDRKIRPLRSPFGPFRGRFIFVDTILNAFPGKIVAAGGSVFKAFIGADQGVRRQLFGRHAGGRELLFGCDVDLFFIDCTKADVDKIIRFAWDLVNDQKAIKKIIERLQAENLDVNDTEQLSCCIDRCQNTTTIYYGPDEHDPNYMAEYGWEDGGGKMQFIHRIYPNKESVIGGFDLGPCMAFYDGMDFWATPFGAWSIATQTIILDVSRRSTSFEYRIAKYVVQNNCKLVIVNGSSAEAYQHLENDPALAKKAARVFYPVKGFKMLSWHVPHAKYEGLDERLKIAREQEVTDQLLSIDNNDDEEAHDPQRFHQRMLLQQMQPIEARGQRFAVDQKTLNEEIDREADEDDESSDRDHYEENDAPRNIRGLVLNPHLAAVTPPNDLSGLLQLFGNRPVAEEPFGDQGDESGSWEDVNDEDAAGARAMINAVHGVSFYQGGRRVRADDPDDPVCIDMKLEAERTNLRAKEAVNRNRFVCEYTDKNRMSDYDGGQFNGFNVVESNAIFAAKGKIECITWRSSSAKGAFETPQIDFRFHPKMEMITEETSVHDIAPVLYLDALRRWFSEDQIERIRAGPTQTPQVVPIKREVFKTCVLELRETIHRNIQRAKDLAAMGITIITENPGRQWTASNNPVVGDVRDYYHPVLLAVRPPLKIGISDKVFCLLVFARTRNEGGCLTTWRRVPRDVFGLIMTHVLALMATDGNLLLLGIRP